MTGTARLSYSHGASPDPLLGETIGDNLRRIAAAHPGREVLVRRTYHTDRPYSRSL